MSWKFDLAAVAGIGVGAYLLISNAGGIRDWIANQLGGGIAKETAEAAGSVANYFYQSGADTGSWLKYFLEGNLGNLASPVGAYPSEETLALEKQAGYYYEPQTHGFIPIGYAQNPVNPTRSALIQVTNTQQQAAIQAGASYYMGGSAPSYASAINQEAATNAQQAAQQQAAIQAGASYYMGGSAPSYAGSSVIQKPGMPGFAAAAYK